MKIIRLTEGIKAPTRATHDSVGADVYAPFDFTIGIHELIKFPLGFIFRIPEGYYGRLAPKSSLGAKGINVLGGVIDPDYEGEVSLILVNHSNKALSFSKNQKVAQLIVEKCSTPLIELIGIDGQPETIDHEMQTRNGGFGSTGA